MTYVPRRALVLDLETVGIDDAVDFIEEPSAPSNYVDPKKIEAYIAKARAERINETGLDIDLARIVALGVTEYPGDTAGRGTVHLFRTEAEERATLQALQRDLETSMLITFSGAKFDLPLLARRYLYLGLPALAIELDRYRSPHIDLYERLSLRGYAGAHKLSWYCKRLGWLDCLSPLQGAEMAQAVREGRWEEVQAHCAGDVLATWRLAQWMGIETEGLAVGHADRPSAPAGPIL